MAKQTVNLGVVPDGVSGDDVRTGFTKVNDNFTELYTEPTDAVVDAGSSTQIGAWSPVKWRRALTGAMQQVEGTSEALPMSQKGITIISKDRLRQSVESASGGRNTIIYDAQGNPNTMVVIPRYNLEYLPFGLTAGTHPAFLTNGVPRSEIFVAKYLASAVGAGTQVMAGQVPLTYVNFDASRSLCTSKGVGWSLSSAHVWSAVALLSIANGTQPRGNTYYGRSHEKTFETGRRHDGSAPGDTAGVASTLTGSGPESWYHDGTYFGVCDLVGNVWEWVDQLKIVDGRIISTLDNNSALSEASWTQHQAFLSAVSDIQLSGVAGVAGSSSVANRENMVKQASYVSSNLLKTLLVEPLGETIAGALYVNTEGERIALRGGNWNSTSGTGLGSLYLTYARSATGAAVGFRPAFVV